MAISINQYVDITSGVGAGAVATTRALVGRMFTGSTLLPINTFLSFSTASEVGKYFGTSSEEYERAVFYFSWVSKNVTRPQTIQFARFVNQDSAPSAFGIKGGSKTIAEWQSITNGAFGISIAGQQENLSGINFTGVSSFSAVAGIVQAAINDIYAEVQQGTTQSSPANQITGLSDTSVLSVGMGVSGVGIPGGTTIAGILSASLIQISADATDIGTQTLTFSLDQDGGLIDTSAIVTGLDTLTLSVGMDVTGVGIPAATTILNIIDLVSITLSNDATATGTETLTFALDQSGDLSIPTLITGLDDTALISVGDLIAGFGITSGTEVATIVDGTSITISNPATETTTSFLSFYTAANAMWAASTVTFDAQRNSFNFVGGANNVDDATIIITPGNLGFGDIDITDALHLGWIPEAENNGQGRLIPADGAIWSAGSLAKTITETLENSANTSNDFGSFLFLNNLSLTEANIIAAATWNATQNVLFLYTVPAAVADVASLRDALESIGGVAVTLSPFANQYPEQMPMMIAAATIYERANSVQNYMFQVFPGVTTSVNSTAVALSYDNIAVNYYGSTQTAGKNINFYQRGLMQGDAVAVNISDINSYVNEIWFKDAASVAIINLLVGLSQVPANAQGRGQVLTALQEVVDQALLNGVISVGKTLTSTQRAFITNATNDDQAWYQVQNSGYWLDAEIAPIAGTSPVQFEANYTLIYGKDDVIRKVVGTHTLI